MPRILLDPFAQKSGTLCGHFWYVLLDRAQVFKFASYNWLGIHYLSGLKGYFVGCYRVKII